MNQVQRDLGAALRQARSHAGMSLGAVEQASGGKWKAVVVGSYERGDRAITVPRLLELAAFYGVPVADLLPGGGQGTPEQVKAQALHAYADWARAAALEIEGGQT